MEVQDIIGLTVGLVRWSWEISEEVSGLSNLRQPSFGRVELS